VWKGDGQLPVRLGQHVVPLRDSLSDCGPHVNLVGAPRPRGVSCTVAEVDEIERILLRVRSSERARRGGAHGTIRPFELCVVDHEDAGRDVDVSI